VDVAGSPAPKLRVSDAFCFVFGSDGGNVGAGKDFSGTTTTAGVAGSGGAVDSVIALGCVDEGGGVPAPCCELGDALTVGGPAVGGTPGGIPFVGA
jgi:hypothetical protein